MARLIVAGIRVQIGADDERITALIERRYLRMMDPQGAGDPDVNAYIISRGPSPGVLIGDEFVRVLEDESAVNTGRNTVAAIEGQAMLAINARLFRRRPELAVFHAGAVAIGDQAAIIVGPTTSGKSTTSVSLLIRDRSCRPLSDEFAMINTRTGEVEAFPRLFSIRPGARRLLGLDAVGVDWEAVEPEALFSSGWASRAHRASFFFLVGRARTASARPLKMAEAIFFAIGNAVTTTVDPNHFRVVDHVIAGLSNARLYALTIGTPDENADLIGRLTAGAEAVVA